VSACEPGCARAAIDTTGQDLDSKKRRIGPVRGLSLKNWLAIGSCGLLLLPFFLPIPADLRRHPVIGLLGDRVHIPLLAVLTVLLYYRGPVAGRFWTAGLLAAVVGGAVEFLQLLVARTAKLSDFGLDLIGIGLALSWLRWRADRSRVALAAGALLLLIIPAQLYYLPALVDAMYQARHRMPLLADFQTENERWLWSDSDGGEVTFVARGADRDQALRVTGDADHNWPGVVFHHFPHDWRGYRTLRFEARCPADAANDSIAFGVRLDDHDGHQQKFWVRQRFQATAEWRTYTLDLARPADRDAKRTLLLDEESRGYLWTMSLVKLLVLV